jgi:hypothetical protein
MHHRLSRKLFAVDNLQLGASLQRTGRIMIAGFTQTVVFGSRSHSLYPSVTSKLKALLFSKGRANNGPRRIYFSPQCLQLFRKIMGLVFKLGSQLRAMNWHKLFTLEQNVYHERLQRLEYVP